MTRRKVAAAVTAGALTALALTVILRAPQRGVDSTEADGNMPSASGLPSANSPSPVPSAVASGTVGGPSSPNPASSATGIPVPSGTAGGPFLAIGSLSDGRVLVGDLADVTNAKGAEHTYRARVVSPVVGAPWTMVALPGRQLAVSATNQAELVLLTDGLTKLRTLDVRRALRIPEDTLISYGALAARDGTVYGAAAWRNSVAAFAVDVASWTVRASEPVEDKAQFPHTCLTSTGVLAVLTTERLTLLSTPRLATVTSVRLDGSPIGLECAGSEVVVSDDLEPRVRRFDRQGRVTATLTYDGTGAAQTAYGDGVLYLSDEVRKTVVRCVLATSACRVSQPFDGRPYSLLRAGDALLMGMQTAKQLVVMDPATLAVRAMIPFPGMPRAFAIIE